MRKLTLVLMIGTVLVPLSGGSAQADVLECADSGPAHCVPEYTAPCWTLGGVPVKCAWAYATLQYNAVTFCGQDPDEKFRCAIPDWAGACFSALGGVCTITGKFDGVALYQDAKTMGAAGNAVFPSVQEHIPVLANSFHCAATTVTNQDALVVLVTVAEDLDCDFAS